MISKLNKYIEYVRKITGGFYANRCHLKPGHYLMSTDHEKLIFRDDPDTSENINKFFIETPPKRSILNSYKDVVKRFILPKRLVVNDNNDLTRFNGTVLYFSSGQHEIRIFNFEAKKVLSVYKNDIRWMKHLENYHYFNRYFKMPEITSHDDEAKTSVEEMILHKPQREWTKDDKYKVMDEIFGLYKRYFRICIQEGKVGTMTLKHMLESLKKDPVLDEFGFLLERKLPPNWDMMELPFVKQHGDIWRNNVLLKDDDEKIFFIDWEHAGEYVFLFDLFKWIDLEAVFNNNSLHLKEYLRGGYDKEFIELFSLFGLDFEKKYRTGYYCAYFIDHLYKRVITKAADRKAVVKMSYSRFLVELLDLE
ncbi:MAG: phosphotransferase [Bacillota bacterium]|nr:phosphotransferase [Bacillota bacterium]MDW7676582.1 phosphotransferase [Bacillota bacterium]